MRFEPKISTGEQPQTYALDRAATGTGLTNDYPVKIIYGLYKIAVSTDRICKKVGGACRKIVGDEADTALNNQCNQRIWDNRRIDIDDI